MNSSKKKIIIRVDGNSNIGLGHIYRGIALAEMLKNDFDVCFVTKQDSTINPIIEAGFSYKFLSLISYLDEPEWLKQNIDNIAIIICDGYEFKTEYQKQIKQQGFKLVYIDDLVEYHMYADLVINHSLGIKQEDYKAEPYTKFALGFDYAILRPAFIEASKQMREIKSINTAFVCFGGADIYDLTLKTTEIFLQFDEIKRINVLVGASYKHKNVFKLKRNGKQIVFHKNLSDKQIVEVILDSDIGIVPSSSILYEVCAVKLPVASGYYVDNQKNIYNGALLHKCIFPLGDLTKLDYSNIFNFISSIMFNKSMLYNQEKVININTKSRIVDLFKSL